MFRISRYYSVQGVVVYHCGDCLCVLVSFFRALEILYDTSLALLSEINVLYIDALLTGINSKIDL